ncbi:MAG: hypothetical protein ACJA1Z_003521 [Patiriisocius sp.]|jgi:hypothetical protein
MKAKFLLISLLITSLGFGQKSTIEEFLKKKIQISNSEHKGNILTVYGFNENGNAVTDSIKFEKSQVLATWTNGFKPSLSIITTPFKVRPSQENIEQKVFTGLTNAGINLDLYGYNLSRYFASGKKSTHRFGAGFFLAPTAEELSANNSELIGDDKYKQLFISLGFSLTYKYNDITFSFIPAGWDIATASVGKSYVYNEKRWWGFGIGISTKLLGLGI